MYIYIHTVYIYLFIYIYVYYKYIYIYIYSLVYPDTRVSSRFYWKEIAVKFDHNVAVDNNFMFSRYKAKLWEKTTA